MTIYYTAMLQEPRAVYEYNGLNWRTVVLRDALGSAWQFKLRECGICPRGFDYYPK